MINDSFYALASILLVMFSFGYLLSVPLMRRQYKLHLERERILELEINKLQIDKKVKVDRLKGKIRKLKFKLKNKKNGKSLD